MTQDQETLTKKKLELHYNLSAISRKLSTTHSLLKCLGRLVNFLKETTEYYGEKHCGQDTLNNLIEVKHEGDSFECYMVGPYHDTMCKNLHFKLGGSNFSFHMTLYLPLFSASYNPWPLKFADDTIDPPYDHFVFTEDGDLSPEFLQYISEPCNQPK